MELWRLVAHSHWFTVKLFNRELRLCSRCSGYILGYLVPVLLIKPLGLPVFPYLEFEYQVSLVILLSIPLIFDWLSQSWGWRDSTNVLRFFTGALMGAAIALYSSINATLNSKILLYVYSASIITLIGLLGTQKRYNQLRNL